ncbi:hypothetical protein IPM62_03620 [Candidatus Woesebacteria bacterium]|nr:MAG: hypothetical protein IPM62_03620 [Candidatus Woesebacteria bacterium]
MLLQERANDQFRIFGSPNDNLLERIKGQESRVAQTITCVEKSYNIVFSEAEKLLLLGISRAAVRIDNYISNTASDLPETVADYAIIEAANKKQKGVDILNLENDKEIDFLGTSFNFPDSLQTDFPNLNIIQDIRSVRLVLLKRKPLTSSGNDTSTDALLYPLYVLSKTHAYGQLPASEQPHEAPDQPGLLTEELEICVVQTRYSEIPQRHGSSPQERNRWSKMVVLLDDYFLRGTAPVAFSFGNHLLKEITGDDYPTRWFTSQENVKVQAEDKFGIHDQTKIETTPKGVRSTLEKAIMTTEVISALKKALGELPEHAIHYVQIRERLLLLDKYLSDLLNTSEDLSNNDVVTALVNAVSKTPDIYRARLILDKEDLGQTSPTGMQLVKDLHTPIEGQPYYTRITEIRDCETMQTGLQEIYKYYASHDDTYPFACFLWQDRNTEVQIIPREFYTRSWLTRRPFKAFSQS